MNFKVGDKVKFKNDSDKSIYKVYAVYSKNSVSLGLKDYPDTEQNYQTNTSKLLKV